MSRVAKYPISLPPGVEISIGLDELSVKGAKGQLSMPVNAGVRIQQVDDTLTFEPSTGAVDGWAQAGTARAVANNLVVGVTGGFERRLQLVGVGYRAQAQGRKLTLSLGFSHPVEYTLPEGVDVETPTPTEVVLRSIDKQALGQVAAEIRGFRPPEPYKGKGVRYADEYVRRKEAKKK